MNRLSAIVLGALVGTGLGMFLAPQSGRETRRRLRLSWEDLQGQTQERLTQGRLRMTELIRSGQERVDELARRGEVEVPQTLTRTRVALDDVAQRAAEASAPESEPPFRSS